MKKKAKTKSPQTDSSAAQDIVGLITTLVERLVSLEAKMDTMLSRIPPWPVEPLRQHPSPPAPPAISRTVRPMYTAICADCGKNCEVPFKPSAGRSVYCKACYSVRRNKSSADIRPKEAQPINARQPEKPRPVRSAVSAVNKKPAAKKVRKKA